MPRHKLKNGSLRHGAAALRRARALRSNQTASERIVWELLRNERLGFRFRRQHPVSGFYLDFYCPECKVCVEVDRPDHADRTNRDAGRDETLAALGIVTVRIPSIELFEPVAMNLGKWERRIKDACRAQSEGAP